MTRLDELLGSGADCAIADCWVRKSEEVDPSKYRRRQKLRKDEPELRKEINRGTVAGAPVAQTERCA